MPKKKCFSLVGLLSIFLIKNDETDWTEMSKKGSQIKIGQNLFSLPGLLNKPIIAIESWA